MSEGGRSAPTDLQYRWGLAATQHSAQKNGVQKCKNRADRAEFDGCKL